MMYIHLNNAKKVDEILPESTYEKGPKHWYGEEFAKDCIETDETVQIGMFYDGEHFVNKPEPEIKSLEQQVSDLTIKNTQLEQDNLTTLEALAEVYELMLGGM